MPRPVAIRASYNSDASHLLRLEEAIGKDTVNSEEWKRQACTLVRAAASFLLTAIKPEPKPKPKASR
jgi:hypothetical protein